MVPDQQRPDESRPFSPEVEAALEAALLEPWSGGAPSVALHRALKAAAHDARQRLLRAEEMLVAFKTIEQRVSARRSGALAPSTDDRTRLIRALIDAYYKD